MRASTLGLVTKILILTVVFGLSRDLSAQTPKGEKTTADGKFTIEVELDRLPILSQGRTGTCWSFATVSFLESEIARVHGKQVDLSELYPVYFCYIEKAKRYFAAKGKNTFGQGGLCHDVFDAIKVHGLAPQSAYSGLCDEQRRHNHAEMEKILTGIVEKLGKGKRRPSKRWEKAYRAVLDTYLGETPVEFEFDGKTMTPQQFAGEVLGFIPDDYLEMMSYTKEGMWSRAKLDVPDNWTHEDDYVNVPVETMMKNLDGALRKGFTVAVDMDVSEKAFQARKGVAVLDDELEKEGAVTDALRQAQFDDKSTTDDHLMHVVGIAKDKSGKTYYVTKNSWGEKIGPYGGYMFISKNYVALKLLSFAAHREAFDPQDLKKVANQ